jgi:cytochrome c biogenesis protein CcdA
MQAYVVLMVLLVIGGTLLDVVHKKSAKYFFEKGQSLKKLAKREVGGGEKLGMAVSTLRTRCWPPASSPTPSVASRTCSRCTASSSSS